MKLTHYASTPTPKVSPDWKNLSIPERKKKISDFLEKSYGRNANITVHAVPENGQVVLVMQEGLPANQRGSYLLTLEKLLKENVDQGLTVWLEPVGDKSSLRKLRGVEIKTGE